MPPRSIDDSPASEDLIRALYDRFATRFDDLFASLEHSTSGWEAIKTAIDGTIDIVRRSPTLLPVMVRMTAIDPSYRPRASPAP